MNQNTNKTIISGLSLFPYLVPLSVEDSKDFVSFLKRTNGKYELCTFGRSARKRIKSFEDVEFLNIDQYLRQVNKNKLQISSNGQWVHVYITKDKSIDCVFQDLRSLYINQLRLIETYPESLIYWKQEYVQAKRFGSEQDFLKENPKPTFPKFYINYEESKINLSVLNDYIHEGILDGQSPNLSLSLTICCENAISYYDNHFINLTQINPVSLEELEKNLVDYERNSEILNQMLSDFILLKDSNKS